MECLPQMLTDCRRAQTLPLGPLVSLPITLPINLKAHCEPHNVRKFLSLTIPLHSVFSSLGQNFLLWRVWASVGIRSEHFRQNQRVAPTQQMPCLQVTLRKYILMMLITSFLLDRKRVCGSVVGKRSKVLFSRTFKVRIELQYKFTSKNMFKDKIMV